LEVTPLNYMATLNEIFCDFP